MKKLIIIILFICFGLSIYFITPVDKKNFVTNYTDKIYLSAYQNTSHIWFVENIIKPKTDEIAMLGYPICSKKNILQTYKNSSSISQQKIIGSTGSIGNFIEIMNQVKSKRVSYQYLPKAIRKTNPNLSRGQVGRLATFYGLACGGGVAIELTPANRIFHIHYGVKNMRTGRSFSQGPNRKLLDISYFDFLNELEIFLKKSEKQSNIFYQTVFEILLSNNLDSFQKLNSNGQALATDFFAVYDAEYLRNLMRKKIRPHWESAFLEVLLLANFHSGQKEFMFYYSKEKNDPVFTATTPKQTPCQISKLQEKSSLNDYLQYSKRPDGAISCSLSGLNNTKSEFRKLGSALTLYLKNNYKDSFSNIIDSMDLSNSENIFESLSNYLINDKPINKKPQKKDTLLIQHLLKGLDILRADSEKISHILKKNPELLR